MDPFKVAIVGGSIAGLTLANFLDKFGIEFVLLEAYDEIAPQVGASIGWHPNGLRILEQLGCYQDILAASAPVKSITMRDGDGGILYSHRIFESIKDRHGYDLRIMERRVAVDILFKNLKSKDRVHTGQRLMRVEQTEGGILLHTAAGSTFKADIVVGADGIHSTVRHEIWDQAGESDPSILDEAAKMKTEYGCIFGISSPTGDLKASEIHNVHKKNISVACMVGPDDKPYWFLFFKLPKLHTGVDLPRFSREYEAALVSKEAETFLTPNVSVKQLYDNVLFSTTTPLPHHVFSRWYFGRCILVGDSAHKFNPISGQGGNSAVESAAALADHLIMALRQNNCRLSGQEIETVFAKTVQVRQSRVIDLVEDSIRAQRLSAWPNAAFKFLDTRVVPRMNTSMFADTFSSLSVGAYKSQSLRYEVKNTSIPFDDELPVKPKTGSRYSLLVIATYSVLFYLMYQGVVVLPRSYGTDVDLQVVIQQRKYEGHHQLMRNSDRVPVIGPSMSYLIMMYFPATESWDIGFWILTFYLSTSELVVFATWAIESCRTRNSLKPSRAAVIFGSISNVSAIAYGACVFYGLDSILTSAPSQWWTTATFVPPRKAGAVLPAILIGMFLPTLLMFNVWLPSNFRQYLTIAWMFSPIFVFCLMKLFSGWDSGQQTDNHSLQAGRRSTAQLKRLYAVLAVITGLTHILSFAYIGFSADPDLSISRIFGLRYLQGMSVYQGSQMMFLWNLYIMDGAILLWNVFSTLALSRAGVIRVNILQLLFAMALGSVLIGPAATSAVSCMLRESQIAATGIKEKDA